MSRPDGWRPPRGAQVAAQGAGHGLIAMVRPDRLQAAIEAARVAWLEMVSSVTSYAMRHAAEMRYLSLRRLAGVK